MKVNRNESCTCTSRPKSRGYTPALVALAGAAAVGMSASAQFTQSQVANSPNNAGVNHTEPVSHPAVTGELGGKVSHGQAIPYVPGAAAGTTQSTVTIIADGVSHVVDLTCEESIGAFGDPANVVLSLDLGAGAHVTDIGWDVQLEAFDPSWLSELRVEMTDTNITTGVGLSPGAGDDFPGQGAYASPPVNLIDLGLDFNVGADGNLRIELWDTFIDFPGAADGTWGWDCDGGPGPGPDSNCCAAHDDPGCDDPDCEALICNQDPFCCDVQWDDICADMGNDQCDVCDETPGGPSNCCTDHGGIGCDDPDCQALICGQDSFCCDVAWDGICADAANAQCDVCDGGGPGIEGCGEAGTGDCCSANGTPFCDDGPCCEAVCAGDPFCCDVEWDNFCATTGFDPDCTLGPGNCGAENTPECDCEGVVPQPCVDGVGDCCVDHGGLGCDDEDCCTLVCNADAFCCDVAWDGLCAGAAQANCPDACAPPGGCGEPDAGDCCSANGTPFCNDGPCCEAVCAGDPFCCDVEWDNFCATTGFDPDCTLGPGNCGAENTPECDCEPQPVCPDGATGDCCTDHGGLGCENEECCEQICIRDAFCCDVAWDGLCAGAAQEECTVCLSDEGCGIGFWKNHSAHAPGNQPDVWVGHDADDLFADTFATIPGGNGNGGDSNCCEAHGGIGCDDPACQALICGQDAFCCDVAWDGLCAGAAQTQCDVCLAAASNGGNAHLQGIGAVGNGVPSSTTGATIVDFDVTGIESIEAFGNALNEVFNLNVGANAHVTGVGWDVTIEAFSPSWLSEMRVEFTDTDITGGVGLSVGVGDGFPGTASYSSDGILDLIGLGLDFNVGADGNLRLEFWETFVDFAGAPDGVWITGTLSFEIGGEGGNGPGSNCCIAHGGIGCDDPDCEALICGQDAFCCDVSWDGLCAGAAEDQCDVCQDDNGNGPDSNCCEAHGGIGCDDPDCEALICGQDAFCCDVSWDGLCAGAAEDQCDVCQDDNGNGPDSNCCTNHGGIGCDDPDCEALICSQDAFCCDVAWDTLCANAANEQCAVCTGDPGPEPVPQDVFGDCTLHDVLSSPAGGPNACSDTRQLNNLGRHAVAALLNAAHPDVSYLLTEDEVISIFNDAVAEWQETGDIAALTAAQEIFAAANDAEDGCPLSSPADINADGMVNADDLLLLLNAWGADCRFGCPEDIVNNGTVGVDDLLLLLNEWGQ